MNDNDTTVPHNNNPPSEDPHADSHASGGGDQGSSGTEHRDSFDDAGGALNGYDPDTGDIPPVIFGETVHIELDRSTGGAGLVVELGEGQPAVFVELGEQHLASLDNGIREVWEYQRGDTEQLVEPPDDRREWTRIIAGGRADPAGLTALSPNNRSTMIIVATLIVLGFLIAVAM